MITDVVGKKRTDLTYLIHGKEAAIVRMFSDSIQYWIREPLKVLLIMNNRKLNASIGRKLIPTPLDANDNIVKMDKLAHVTEVVLSLDELHNAANLQNGQLSNTLLRYQVTGSQAFTSFKPVTPQYKT